MSSKNEEAIQSLSFEQAYKQLEETIQKLETGNLPLAEAIALYQQGMTLAKQCNVQLDNAELTVKRLTPGGELEDFDELE